VLESLDEQSRGRSTEVSSRPFLFSLLFPSHFGSRPSTCADTLSSDFLAVCRSVAKKPKTK